MEKPTPPESSAVPSEDDARPANRLAKQSSPYLLLHAHNPVDWYPWGPEAFQKAKDENKPIFLSIGYSSCYWCHVMERLVFSNPEIARYMNEHFVNVKVDREERPDVDDVYMTSLQVYYQLTGSPQSGGWPLSMFLTPSGQPFAGGTYFPPSDSDFQMGFPTLLGRIVELWTTRREVVQSNADTLASYVRQAMEPSPASEPLALEIRLVDTAAEVLQSTFDPDYGGLDFAPSMPNAPKFPVPVKLAFLQDSARRTDNAELSRMVATTLHHMAMGGIRDHLGGGFHRYSTDRQWLVPHFEKMLYDNAQLAEVYVAAYRQTNEPLYRQVAEETYDFVLRAMTDPQGGFYSALDAETDGIEGKFYVWSSSQIDAVLGPKDAPVFKHVYGVVESPEFEHGNVLHLPASVEQAAKDLDLPLVELQERLTLMRRELLAARNERPHPLRDEKILTAWNGLMIRSLANASRVLHRTDYLDAAQRAAYFVLDKLRDERGRLLRSHFRGTSKLNAYLDDYAFLISGLLALHEASNDPKWLNAAQRLTDDQIRLFWDERNHGFFFTGHDHEKLLAWTKSSSDSVLPSGNSVSAQNLIQLAQATHDAKYRQYAKQTIQFFAPWVKNAPRGSAGMAWALSGLLGDAASSPPDPAVVPLASESRAEIVTTAAQASAAGTETTALRLVPFAISQATQKPSPLTVRAFLPVDRLTAGSTCPIAVVIDIQDGWHINTNPAQPNYLIPTTLTLRSKNGTQLTDVVYPKGKTFRMPGFDEPLSVYEKQVVIRGTLQVSAMTSPQTANLELQVKYQACNDRACSPPASLTCSGSVPIVPADTPGRPINTSLFAPPTSKNAP